MLGSFDKSCEYETLPKLLLKSRETKVKSISFLCRYGQHPYRLKNNLVAKSIKGVRLHFTNGLSTERLPIDKSQAQREKEITIPVDPTRKISKIRLGLSICDSVIAFQAFDPSGKLLID